ncbi:MAG TPA: c-type cytochrome biogenesis protein CcmI [Azonexus sp.]|nr:c-type cytochrome biogenesis protein CcmI [Azonexus sp.]
MTQFAIFATLLIVVVAAFILPPLWLGLRAPKPRADRKEANIAIFRDQLKELETEKTEGMLADADFEQARRELQRRLLEDVEPDAAAMKAAPASHAPSRKTAIAILLLLPVLALLGYGMLGKPQALDPMQTSAPPKMTAEQISGMVASLAEKMKANPDDMQGWLMLARSYKTMGRYEEAAEAYGKAEKVINDDPELLASYAETIAMAAGKGLKGKPAQLIERALKLDPQNAHALFLAGAAAMEAGDNKKGIAYWEALLPQVEPGSEIDQMLRSGIDKMKAGG